MFEKIKYYLCLFWYRLTDLFTCNLHFLKLNTKGKCYNCHKDIEEINVIKGGGWFYDVDVINELKYSIPICDVCFKLGGN